MDSKSDTNSAVDGVRDRLMNDWKILENVFKLVQQKETFCADPKQWNEEKIVDFMQPNELKVGVRNNSRRHCTSKYL